MSQAFGEHTVGIHIRRRDHTKSINNSPKALFVDRMKAILSENAETTFFLATDCEETERDLVGLFDERIFVLPKRSRDRDTPECITDGFVDMLCLSRTTRIIGSAWSSFSRAASQIGRIEREVLSIDRLADRPGEWGPLV